MEKKNNSEDSKCFPVGQSAQEKRFSHVPECYKPPQSHMPSLNPKIANVPTIDLSGLNDPDQRPVIIKEISNACLFNGFFQIRNHGIPQEVLDEALAVAFEFFQLPNEHKAEFMSSDVHKPARYSSSIKDGEDKIQFWRVFLKHYANPLEDWISIWPRKPESYREKMGRYSTEVQKLSIDIMGAITESLGLGATYSSNKFANGAQVVNVNCYPPCPQPNLALGLPPHTDYSCVTILLQSSDGLEILDKTEKQWKSVPYVHGAIQVHVGDHLEVLSNGIYPGVLHRAVLNNEKTRISIASLHSLGMDEKMETAKELIDDEHPIGYKASSFRDFLDFISKNSLGEGKSFLQSLKIEK